MKRTGEKAKNSIRAQSSYAKRKGIIQKPDCCSNCNTNTEKLEMHHPNYSDPYNIKWLCSNCHIKLHEEIGEIKAPIFYGRELRAKQQTSHKMPDIIRDKLKEKNDTLKGWCQRRRIQISVVYALFSGRTLGLYGESARARRYLDMHFLGWDSHLNQMNNDTHQHLKFARAPHFSEVLKKHKMKL